MSISKITMILDILGDGRWHEVDALVLNFELSDDKFGALITFLSKYGFVKVDEENMRVKLNRDFQKLLTATAT
jgi:DNA-binding IclR family transcriptional regulator